LLDERVAIANLWKFLCGLGGFLGKFSGEIFLPPKKPGQPDFSARVLSPFIDHFGNIYFFLFIFR
jgi:hypothetical protein